MSSADCCDDGGAKASFQDVARRANGRQILNLFRLEDPLPKEIEDPADYRIIFDTYKAIPYASTAVNTGHRLLYLYLMLASLSPSQSAVVSKLQTFAVGSRAKIVKRRDSDFDEGEEDAMLSDSDIALYRNAIKENIEFSGKLRAFARKLVWQYKITGNAWVEMRVSEVQGQTRIYLQTRKTTEILYRLPEKGSDMRVALYSPSWIDRAFLHNNAPVPLLLYPNFSENADGVRVTLFHLKNNAGQTNWYGRPDSEGSIGAQYAEMQNWMFLLREASSGFTGRIIGEIEEDDPEAAPLLDNENARKAGFDSFQDRLEYNFTQKGDDPSSMLIFSRPTGAAPAVFHNFRPYTTEDWYIKTGDMHRNTIFRAHGLSNRFMGEEVASGFASDSYLQDYMLLNEPTISDLHETVIGEFLNNILNACWIELKQPQFTEYSIRFDPPIAKILTDYKNGLYNAVEMNRSEQIQKTPSAPNDINTL